MSVANPPGGNAESEATLVPSPSGGRRRGDAILIAFHYALDHDDAEVAAQLLAEYEKINGDAPMVVAAERRKESVSSTLSRLWQQFRRKFTS